MIEDFPGLEANAEEELHFIEVGDTEAVKDELVDLIGTLKQHTKQVGENIDGDNVAIGEITSDEDQNIK